MTGPGLSEDDFLDPTVSSIYAFLFDWWASADDLPAEVDRKAADLCLRLLRQCPTLTEAEIDQLMDRLWQIGLGLSRPVDRHDPEIFAGVREHLVETYGYPPLPPPKVPHPVNVAGLHALNWPEATLGTVVLKASAYRSGP